MFDDIVHVERAASMTLSRRQRAELPEESISVYLMYGDEITLTRGTGALWQLGAEPASLIDSGLCGCFLARKLVSKSMSASGGVSRGAESWYGTWSNGV